MDWVAAEGPHAGMTRVEAGLVAAELPVVWGYAEPEPESEPALHVASDGLQRPKSTVFLRLVRRRMLQAGGDG